MLTVPERQRYSRHILLPEVGEAGQEKLKASRVLIVGAGGLGSPAALYLAAAGVGTIGIVDFDAVDVTNLQRQILHGAADVGRAKLDSARDRILAIDADVRVEAFAEPFSVANAKRLVDSFDVIVDGTDNFPARYLVNDACVLYRKPNAWGSIQRFEGQAAVFGAPGGPCYRCLHPEPPPAGLIQNCAEAGVLGVLPGVIGTIQATEAIKLVLGIGESLAGRLIVYDALRMRFRELRLPKDPDCPMCGTRPVITELRESAAHCEAASPGRTEAKPGSVREITVAELKARLDAGDRLQILDVREPWEVAICAIAGSLRIPLGDLPQRVNEVDPGVDLVVQCKTGRRSASAVELLHAHGLTRAVNLAGGIFAWINEIDPSLPRY